MKYKYHHWRWLACEVQEVYQGNNDTLHNDWQLTFVPASRPDLDIMKIMRFSIVYGFTVTGIPCLNL